MLAAIGMELGPEIRMILIPPVPAGEATAAIVESTIGIDAHPPANMPAACGQRQLGGLSKFLLRVILLTDGKDIVDQPVKN